MKSEWGEEIIKMGKGLMCPVMVYWSMEWSDGSFKGLKYPMIVWWFLYWLMGHVNVWWVP